MFILTNINLSNFNTNNVTDMNGMFYGCKKLKNENIIIKDKMILSNNELFKEYKFKIIKINH